MPQITNYFCVTNESNSSFLTWAMLPLITTVVVPERKAKFHYFGSLNLAERVTKALILRTRLDRNLSQLLTLDGCGLGGANGVFSLGGGPTSILRITLALRRLFHAYSVSVDRLRSPMLKFRSL